MDMPFVTDVLNAYAKISTQLPPHYAKYFRYLPYAAFFFLISVLLTPLFGKIATLANIFDLPPHERKLKKTLNKHDNPDRHIHKRRVPFLGGLAVVIPFIIYLFIFIPENPSTVLPLLVGTLILVISGLVDDILNLPSTIQFLIQLLAGLIIALCITDLTVITMPFNIEIPLDLVTLQGSILGMPLSLVLPGDLFLVFWIMVCINAVKWMGGSDGLLESNCIVALMALYLLGVREYNFLIIFFSISLIGSMSGYLVYNYPPAKIFTGATGKMVYGYILAVMSIIGEAKFATTLIILALPIMDFTYVIIKRYIVYRPKNPLQILRINSRDHLHHKLLDLGFSPKKVILIEVSAMLTIGSLGFLAIGANRFFLLVLLITAGLAGIFTLDLLRKKAISRQKIQKDTQSPESKYSY